MANSLMRWDGSQWVQVAAVGLYSAGAVNNPHILSAENTDDTHTRITFDRAVTVDPNGDLDAFSLYAYTYWVRSIYNISSITVEDATHILLTHDTIGNCDDELSIAYASSKGLIIDSDGLKMPDQIFHYQYYNESFIKIRYKDLMVRPSFIIFDNMSILSTSEQISEFSLDNPSTISDFSESVILLSPTCAIMATPSVYIGELTSTIVQFS